MFGFDGFNNPFCTSRVLVLYRWAFVPILQVLVLLPKRATFIERSWYSDRFTSNSTGARLCLPHTIPIKNAFPTSFSLVEPFAALIIT